MGDKSKTTDQIIKAIWADLCDRSGYDLGCLDKEIQKEIRAAWRKLITKILVEHA